MATINNEQLVAANKAAVESLLAVANTALSSAERIAALNLTTARTALEESAANTQAVLGAKDPQAAFAAQASLVQPAVEKAVAYSRSVYEISSEAQQEFAQLVEAQFGDFQKRIAGLIDQAAKAAPAGSEGAFAAIQSAMAAANSAFDNMKAMAKQVSEVAESNLVVASSAVTKAAAASKKAK